MLTLVSDQRPEELVYIDCSSAKQALVVHLVAAESIWRKLHEEGFEAATNVEVKRTEVAIKVADSKEFHALLLKLLRRSKTENGTVLRHVEIASEHYFSSCEFMKGCFGGVAATPPGGSPSARLVEIGKLLAQAADAPKQRKAGLVSTARSKAKELSKLLEKMTTYGESAAP